MSIWEYKGIEFDSTGFAGGLLDLDKFNESLNEVGRDGWELVSCMTTNQSHGATRKIVAVFKRKR